MKRYIIKYPTGITITSIEPVEVKIAHQKKVIDRLSRKIQRLKRQLRDIALFGIKQVGIQVELKEQAYDEIIKRDNKIEKAISYIKQELSWAIGSEELIKILEGKDENYNM